jgi:N6-L-threonylcarbamoyladenine synthase
MRVLGIETSCDETAAAVVEDGRKAITNEIASQIDIHARFGGIVPEVASRQHILAIIPVLERAVPADCELDGIAVTVGPGLAGSLIVGLNAAKAISLAKGLPLVGINHLEAHIYANWLGPVTPQFPLIALIVSGGHSDLILMREHLKYVVLGRTRDDAAGEAFDKAARILGLGYPGGPAIERAAFKGKPTISLPRPWLEGSYDFSFSGLKTALFRLVSKERDVDPYDAAASFQEAVTDVLVKKTLSAAREYGARNILLAGGVAANKKLREKFQSESPMPVIFPELVNCTDNAAMVAACGYLHLKRGEKAGLELDAIPDLSLQS